LLGFWVALHPYLNLNAKFKYPAFLPGPYPAKSFAHPGINCTEFNHYTEYDLRFVIEANMHAQAFKWKWDSPIWRPLNMSIISGCLFKSDGPLDEELYSVKSSLNQLGLSADGFKMAFIDHLVKYLTNAEAVRLEVTILNISVNSFNVKVQAFQTDPDKIINLKRLNDIIDNQLSDFYSDNFGQLIKGKIEVSKH